MSLTLKNISKAYDGKSVLCNFSYEFPDTGLFLLVGESGVGKTTLLRLISGLDRSFDGEIVGGGLKNSSFAFQEYRLIPELSARENIAVTLSEKICEDTLSLADKALLELGLSESDTRLYPHEMSGGMKQRVSLARAFMKECPILLLDEPTKELDFENLGLLLDRIEKESRYRLVIAVTHEKSHFSNIPSTVITLD